VAIAVISCLKTILYPFLPFSSQRLHELLGYNGKVEDAGWKFDVPPAGQKLISPTPLFTKLEDEVAEEETKRLGQYSP
jgi:methionyl-tRNA synthetase